MNCLICNKYFPNPIWPNVNQKYCCVQHGKKAWKLRHPEYKWEEKNPEASRQIKRRWNWSEKGKLNKKIWYEKNKERLKKEELTKEMRRKMISRGSARKKLMRKIKKVCIIGINCTGKIETHHKDFNPLNNNINNLEWRCKLHHMDRHHEHNLQVLKGLA